MRKSGIPDQVRDDEEKAGPGSGAGMTKREPRWVVPFLRALERTGEVRAAAEDAGIDHTTAYLRRRTHSDFASNWDWVLQAHAEQVEREKAEELERLREGPLPNPSPAEGRGASGGEDLVGSGPQLKRAGHDRWSERKEKLFFNELAATANVRRAAKEAGVSPNAVHARRLRNLHFKAKWAAVLEAGKAAIAMHLVEESRKAFDPEQLETGEVVPKVTVAEAIRIAQLGGSGKQAPAADAFDDESYSYEDDIADIREGLVQKLQALRRRDRPELIARGWSYDESWDREIPPGWVKGPDWRPMEDGEDLV
jgi:hypothetical protein